MVSQKIFMISGIIFTYRLKSLKTPSGCFCHASEPQSCHGNNMIPFAFAKLNSYSIPKIDIASEKTSVFLFFEDFRKGMASFYSSKQFLLYFRCLYTSKDRFIPS